jgi:phosphatidylinositol alpha-mannosyltransferase
VVCVGRLEPRKGVNVLIEAMPRVRQVAGAALVLVGDGPERATLEERARQLNVRTTIIRNVDDDALPAFYQHATVVCAPATSGESFGIVLIEALAARVPVVASRIDGYVDAVGEDSGVRWAVPGDSGDLARQLIAQIEHRDSTDETPRVGAKYDWLRIAGHLTETYNRVTSNEQRVASDERPVTSSGQRVTSN